MSISIDPLKLIQDVLASRREQKELQALVGRRYFVFSGGKRFVGHVSGFKHLGKTLWLVLQTDERRVEVPLDGIDNMSEDDSAEYVAGRSALGVGYATLAEHLIALEYWVREWRSSSTELMTLEEYKKMAYPDFPSWMKVSMKDLSKRDDQAHDGFTYQIVGRAMLRDFESVVEKFKALLIPALDYSLPRDSRKIQEMARAHAQEEKEVLVKTRMYMQPDNMIKAIAELGELRKSIAKFEKIRPDDNEVKAKALAMHQIIDAYIESARKWADPSRRRIGI